MDTIAGGVSAHAPPRDLSRFKEFRMNQVLANVIDLERYPLKDGNFRTECKRTLDENGALVMHNFVKSAAIASIQRGTLFATQKPRLFAGPLSSGR